MNCKQGDLAIVVRSKAGNEGRIVRCVRWAGVSVDERLVFHADGLWEVSPPLTWENPFGDTIELPVFPDAYLRPIRGDLLDEETERELERVVSA